MTSKIKFIYSTTTLDLTTFPFDDVINCLLETQLENTNILKVCDFFYGVDILNHFSFCGFLDPVLLCIYHGDSSTLLQVLEKHPKALIYENRFMSSFEYATKTLQISCLETISCFLLRNKHMIKKVPFSRVDFNILLSSRLTSCHELVGELLTVRPFTRYPSQVFLEKEVQIFYNLTPIEFIKKVKKQTKTVDTLKTKTYRNLDMRMAKTQLQVKSEIEILSIPFNYDFTQGSKDAIHLLDIYSNSKSDSFVESEWKHFILMRWSKAKIFHFGISIIILFYIALLNISLVFLKNEIYVPKAGLILGFTLLLVCFLHFVPYTFYKPKLYFKEKAFVTEFLISLLLISYHFVDLQTDNLVLLKIFRFVLILLIFERCYRLLKFFDYFASLVKIFDEVLSRYLFCCNVT